MKILVTGGLGYIGSHTVVELISSGHTVHIVDDLSNSRLTVLDGLQKILGFKPMFTRFDLCDIKALDGFLNSNAGFDGVIHFAAKKFVGESTSMPLLYYRNNLLALLNLLELMPKHHIDKFIFSSSCTVYGDVKSPPVDESATVQQATSPYGNTKKISEEIIRDSMLSGIQLSATSLRYFNPIGAHPSGLIGELALGVPQNLLPNLFLAAGGSIPQIRVYGSDYNTPDGTAVRDYIHVVDLAKAHIAAIESPNNQPDGMLKVYNLGTGYGISVLEMIGAFEKVTGIKLNVKMESRRKGDIEKIWADPRLAEVELNWKAKHNLDEMIYSHWIWEQKRLRADY